jgi:disulfide bond formation protein DsbB
MTGFATARALALIIPGALMAGALGSQYIGGLVPCEMCVWQRWPHYAAIGLAALGFVLPQQRALIWLAALAILVSGGIGIFHAGVEYKWWEGLTQCSVTPGNGSGNILADIMKKPMIRCDEAQWSLFGISLAGYNAIVSIGGALIIARLLMRKN